MAVSEVNKRGISGWLGITAIVIAFSAFEMFGGVAVREIAKAVKHFIHATRIEDNKIREIKPSAPNWPKPIKTDTTTTPKSCPRMKKKNARRRILSSKSRRKIKIKGRSKK